MSAHEKRKAVYKAIACFHKDERIGFEVARRQAAHLIEIESDPLVYLRATNNDVARAARCLAVFWKMRRELFNDRFDRPMSMAGGGALCDDDIATMRTGWMLIKEHPDRVTMLLDATHDGPTRDSPNSSSSRYRCVFYCLWWCLQTGKPVYWNRYQGNALPPNLDNNVVEILKCFPIPLSQQYALYLAPTPAPVSIVSTFMSDLGKEQHFENKLYWFVARSREELCQFMLYQGLEKHHLPEQLGGSWGRESFERWMEARIRADRERVESFDCKAPAAGSGSVVSPGLSDRDASSLSDSNTDIDPAAEAARRERKRLKDLFYSRERRKKARKTESELNDQVEQLRAHQKRLIMEEESLTTLLHKAMDLAKAYEASTAQAAARQDAVTVASAATSALAIPSQESWRQHMEHQKESDQRLPFFQGQQHLQPLPPGTQTERPLHVPPSEYSSSQSFPSIPNPFAQVLCQQGAMGFISTTPRLDAHNANQELLLQTLLGRAHYSSQGKDQPDR